MYSPWNPGQNRRIYRKESPQGTVLRLNVPPRSQVQQTLCRYSFQPYSPDFGTVQDILGLLRIYAREGGFGDRRYIIDVYLLFVESVPGRMFRQTSTDLSRTTPYGLSDASIPPYRNTYVELILHFLKRVHSFTMAFVARRALDILHQRNTAIQHVNEKVSQNI